MSWISRFVQRQAKRITHVARKQHHDDFVELFADRLEERRVLSVTSIMLDANGFLNINADGDNDDVTITVIDADTVEIFDSGVSQGEFDFINGINVDLGDGADLLNFEIPVGVGNTAVTVVDGDMNTGDVVTLNAANGFGGFTNLDVTSDTIRFGANSAFDNVDLQLFGTLELTTDLNLSTDGSFLLDGTLNDAGFELDLAADGITIQLGAGDLDLHSLHSDASVDLIAGNINIDTTLTFGEDSTIAASGNVTLGTIDSVANVRAGLEITGVDVSADNIGSALDGELGHLSITATNISLHDVSTILDTNVGTSGDQVYDGNLTTASTYNTGGGNFSTVGTWTLTDSSTVSTLGGMIDLSGATVTADNIGYDLTLNAMNGAISLADFDASGGAIVNAVSANSTGTTTINGTLAVGSLATDSGGTTNLAGSITTTGEMEFFDAVTLSGNTILNGVDTDLDASGVEFQSTLTGGAFNLTVTGGLLLNNTASGLGDLDVDSLVAASTIGAGSVVVSGTSSLGGSVTTSGVQTYTGAVTLTNDITLESSGSGAITLGSTVSGAQSLTINTSGLTSLEGAINIGSLNTDMGGTTTISGGSITTTGEIEFFDAVTLADNTTLNGVDGGGDADALGVEFHSTLTGGGLNLTVAGGLLLNNTASGLGDLDVDDLVAVSTIAADSVVVSGTSSLGGAVTTSTTQSYTGAVTLTDNVTLTSNGTGVDGAITFSSTLSGAHDLAIDTIGLTTLSGNVNIRALTTNGGGTTEINDDITVSGLLQFDDAVVLTNNAILTSTDGNITFNNTLNTNGTAHTLQLDAVNGTDGTVHFADEVGTTDAFSSLTVDADSILVDANMEVAGAIDFDATTMTFLANVTTTSDGTVTLTNAGLLTLANTSSFTLDGAFTQDGAGAVSLGSDISTTNDAVSFAGPVSLTDDVIINTDTGAGSITFMNTVAGDQLLTLTAGTGDVDFDASVGSGTALSGLLINSATNITFDSTVAVDDQGLDLTSSGTMTFSGGVTTTTDGNVELTNGGLLTLANGILFNLDGSFTQNGAGLVNTGADITTTGDHVSFASGVTLTQSITIDTTAGGTAVTVGSTSFLSTLDATTAGVEGIELINGTGDISFTGAVGTTELGFVDVESAHDVTFSSSVAAGFITQTAGTGTTTFSSTVNTSSSTGVDLNGTNFTFNGAVTTTNNGGVTITNSGLLDIAAVAFMLDGAFTQDGAGAVEIAGDITTTGDAILLTGPVTLTNGETISLDTTGSGNTTGAGISFLSTLTGETPGAENLTLNAGTAGDVVFTGIVGSTQLGTLTITNAHDVTAQQAITANAFNQIAGTGTTTFNGASLGTLTVSTNAVTLSTSGITTTGAVAITTAQSLTLNAGAGIDAGSETITLNVNQSGGGQFLQDETAVIQTTSESLNAIRLNVANGGNASIGVLRSGTTTGVVSIDVGGAIIDNTTGEAANIIAQATALRAGMGIGSADDIDTQVSLIAFDNTNGTAHIENSGGLMVTAVDGITVTQALGGGSLTANSPLTISMAMIVGGNYDFVAGNSAAVGDDLTINADITHSTGTGTVTFTAGDDILHMSGTIGANGGGQIDEVHFNAGADGIGDGVLGGISQTGGSLLAANLLIQSADTATFTATNDVNTLAADVDGALTFVDVDDLTIGTVNMVTGITTSNDTVSLTSTGLTISGAIAVGLGDLIIDSSAAVTQTAAISGTGLLLTGAGPFTLTNGSNDFTTLAANVTGALSYTDANALTVGTVQGTSDITGTDVTLTTGGLLTLVDSISASGTVSLDVQGATATTGTITAMDLELQGTGTFSLGNANDVDVLAVNIDGMLTFVDSDDLTIGTVNSTVGITTSDDTVSLTSSGLTISSAIAVGLGDLIIDSSAVVTQTAAISGAGLLLTGAGPFTLTNGSNNFVTLAADTTEAISYVDTDALTIGTVNLVAGISTTDDMVTVAAGGLLTVSEAVSTGAGSGGTISLDSLVLNAAVTTGGGGVSLSGGGPDLVINTALSSSTTLTLNADRDVIIGASVTTSAGANINVNADNDADGVGGVHVQTAGFVGSAGDLSITGSDLSTTIGVSDAVVIDADGSNSQLFATGGITISMNGMAPADADLILHGNMNATTGNISVDANGDIFLAANVVADAGNITFLQSLVVTGDSLVQATGGNVSFDSTVDDDGNNMTSSGLVVTAAGTTTFSGDVGTGSAIDSLTTNGGGSTELNGNVTALNAISFDDNVVLTNSLTVESVNDAAITFGGTLNGVFALVVNTSGTTTFTGAVGTTNNLASLETDAGGTTFIDGGAVMTTGNQIFGDALVLGMDTTFTGNNLTFNAIDSQSGETNALIVNSSGAGITRFNGRIGETDALSTITTNADGQTVINTDSVALDGTGATTFSDAVVLEAATTTIEQDGTGSLTFAAAITTTAATSLSLSTSSGNIDLEGDVGTNSTRLSGLSVFSGGELDVESIFVNDGSIILDGTITRLNGGSISATGTGTATFFGPVELTTDVTVTAGSTGSAITFLDTVNGAHALTANTSGVTQFDAAVGTGTALTMLTTDSGGSTVINGGQVTTTSHQLFGDAVIIGANTTFNAGTGDVTFSSTLDDDGSGVTSSDVIVTTSGLTRFNGVVGTVALTSLVTNGGGTTEINDDITVSGLLQFDDAVVLTNNAILTSTDGNITFNNTLNTNGTAHTLQLDAVNGTDGTVHFADEVGTTDAFSSLTVAADSILVDANMEVAGAIDFDATTMTFLANVTTTSGGTVTLTNAGLLTLANTSSFTLDGAFTQDGAGAVSLGSDISTTNDAVSFAGPVSLTDDVIINTDTGTGSITFMNTVAGDQLLTLTAGTGDVDFDASVGSGTALSGLLINSATNITFDSTVAVDDQGLDLTSSGTMTFSGGVTTTTDGNVELTNGGLLTLNGILFNLDGSFTQNGAGLVSTGADITTTGDHVSFASGVTLTQSITIDTTAGGTAVTVGSTSFLSTLDATTAGVEGIELINGIGDISFTGAVGTTELGFVDIESAHDVMFGSSVAAGFITQTAGTGTTTFSSTVDTSTSTGLDLNGTNFTFNGAVTTTNTGGVTITNSGLLDIAAVAFMLDGAFIQDGAGAVEIAGDITTTGDAISFTGPVTLTNGETISLDTTGSGNTTGAGISFLSTLTGETPGAENLTLNAGTAGDVVFTGIVGSTQLGTLTITNAHDVTAQQAITANALNQIAGTGTTTFNGALTTTTSAGVVISTANIVTNAVIDSQAGNGEIDCDAANNITVNDQVPTGDATVSLVAGNMILINGAITNGIGTVELLADDDLTFTMNGSLTSASGAVTLTADADGDANGNGGALMMEDGAFVDAGLGTITISADEDITLGGLATNNSTGDAVRITSTSGSVLDGGDTHTDIVADMAGAVVTITAATGIGANGILNPLDTQIAALDATNTTSGDILIREANDLLLIGASQGGTSNIDIRTLNGTLTVDDGVGGTAVSTSGSGTVHLQATGGNLDLQSGVQTATGAVTLLADLNVNLGGDGDVTTTSGEVSVSAGNNITMQTGSRITSTSGNVTLTADNNASNVGGITMADDSLIDAGTGEISLAASTDIQLGGLATTNVGDNAVSVLSTLGAITDGGDTFTDIDAANGRTNLTATTGIGSTDALEITANRIDVQNTSSGNIALNETDAVDVLRLANVGTGNISLTSGGTITVTANESGITNGSGTTTLTANGIGSDIIVNDQITTTDGNVTLSAGGGVTINDLVTTRGGDIMVTAVDAIMSTLGADLNTSSNGTAAGNVTLHSTAAGVTLNGDVNASGGLNQNGGNVSVVADGGAIVLTNVTTSGNGTGNSGNIEATAAVNISLTGTLTAVGGVSGGTHGTTTLSAGDSIIDDNDGNTQITTGNLSLSALINIGDIIDFEAGTGNAIDVTVLGQLTNLSTTNAGTEINLSVTGDLDAAAGSINPGINGAADLLIQTTGDLDVGTLGNALVLTDGDDVGFHAGGTLVLPDAGMDVGSGRLRLSGVTDIIDVSGRDLGKLTADSLIFESGSAGGATTISTDVNTLTVDLSTAAAGTALTINECDSVHITQITTNDAKVTVNAALDAMGNIEIDQINAGTGDVTLSTVTNGGAIVDTDDTLVDIIGNQLSIDVTGGIANNDQLEVAVNTLAARTVAGDISILDTNGLLLGNVDGVTGVSITGGAVGDDIEISTTGQLTVSNAVTNTGGGHLTLSADAMSGNLIVSDNILATGGDGNVMLLAGNDVQLDAGVSVTSNGAGSNTVLAGTLFNNGGGLTNGSLTADVIMGDGSDITASTGDITVRATRDIAVSILSTSGNITMSADNNGLGGSNGTGEIRDALTGEGANLIGNHADIQASTGVGALDNINTNLTSISLENSNFGDVNLFEVASGSNNSLTITQLSNQNGNVTVETADGDLTVNGAVSTTNAGQMTLRAGDIGGSGDGDLAINSSVDTAAGAITLESLGGNVTFSDDGDVTSLSGDISITANQAITQSLGTVVDAGTGKLSLDANSTITIGQLKTANSATDAVQIRSGADVTTAGNTLNIDAASGRLVIDAESGINLQTKVASLDVINTSGNVTISEVDAVDVIRITDRGTRDTNIDLSAGGTLRVVTGGDGITGNQIEIETTGAGSDLIVESFIEGNQATLTSSDDVRFTANSHATIDGALSINAGNSVETESNVAITAISATVDATQNVTLGDSSNVMITNALDVTAGGSLQTGADVTMSAGSMALDAGADVAFGTGNDLTVANAFTITALGSVMTGALTDVIAGSIDWDAASAMTLGDTNTLDAVGSLALDAGTNLQTGASVELSSTSATLLAGNDVMLGDQNVLMITNLIDINAGNNISTGTGTQVTSGSLEWGATLGSISVGSTNVIDVTSSLTMTAGVDVTTGAGVQVSSDSATIMAGNDINLGTSNIWQVTNALALNSTGDILTGSSTSVTAGSSAWDASGSVSIGDSNLLTIGNALEITAGGSIQTGSSVQIDSDSALLDAAGNVNLGAQTTLMVSTLLDINSAASLTTGDLVEITAGSSTIDATNDVLIGTNNVIDVTNSLAINAGGQVSTGANSSTTAGSLTIDAGDSVTLGTSNQVNVTNNFDILSDNNITTDAGVAVTAASTNWDATGSLLIGDSSTLNIGDVSWTAGVNVQFGMNVQITSDTATIDATNNVSVGDSNTLQVNGLLDISAGNDIQTGASSSISSGSATWDATGSISLGGSNVLNIVNDLAMTAGGDLQTGSNVEINSDTATLDAGGSVSLGASGTTTVTNSLMIDSGSNVLLGTLSSLEAGSLGISAGGNVDLGVGTSTQVQTSFDITQSANIFVRNGASVTSMSADWMTAGNLVVEQGGTIEVVDSLDVNAGDSIVLTDGSNITGTDANAVVTLAAGNSVAVSQIVSHQINITATNGAITDSGDTGGRDLIGSVLNLAASLGIGSQNALETAVDSIMAVNAVAGDIRLANDNAGQLLTINGMANVGDNGSIYVNNIGAMTVAGAMLADGDLELRAIANGGDDDHLTVEAPMMVTGDILLDAGTDLILRDTGLFQDIVGNSITGIAARTLDYGPDFIIRSSTGQITDPIPDISNVFAPQVTAEGFAQIIGDFGALNNFGYTWTIVWEPGDVDVELQPDQGPDQFTFSHFYLNHPDPNNPADDIEINLRLVDDENITLIEAGRDLGVVDVTVFADVPGDGLAGGIAFDLSIEVPPIEAPRTLSSDALQTNSEDVVDQTEDESDQGVVDIDTATDERIVILQKIGKDGEIELDKLGRPIVRVFYGTEAQELLDDLNDLFGKLRDGHWRIYLKEGEDAQPQLVRDVTLQNGKPESGNDATTQDRPPTENVELPMRHEQMIENSTTDSDAPAIQQDSPKSRTSDEQKSDQPK